MTTAMGIHRPIFPVLVALLLAVPWLTGCGEAPAPRDPLPRDATVLAFGDSVTHGTGAGSGEDYPSRLARDSGWRVVNGGIPGDTARGGRQRIGPLLQEFDPQLVLIGLGGNDLLRRRPAEQIKEDLRAIIVMVRDFGAIPVLIAVPEVSPLRATLGALADAPLYHELAAEEEVMLIDGVFSEVLSSSALRADPIHPNADGYRRFAAGVLQALDNAGFHPPDD